MESWASNSPKCNRAMPIGNKWKWMLWSGTKAFSRNERNGKRNLSRGLKNGKSSDYLFSKIDLYILLLLDQVQNFFIMNSGYLGLIIKPKGDLSLACSSLLGCLGFSILCFSSISLSCFLEGSDLLGILLNFSFLNTSCWIFLCVDNGR